MPLEKTHFVVSVSVEKVTRRETGETYRSTSSNENKEPNRRVTELAKIHVKAGTLEAAQKQITGHVALIVDGDFE